MRPRYSILLCMIACLAQGQRSIGNTYRGGLIEPPLAKPRFVLNDTTGTPYDFWNRTQGAVTLLFFGYTYCPDQCPMHMANLSAALKKLPPEVVHQVKLVFVTTDPARDNAAVLRKWLDNFNKDFIGLTGTEAALSSVQRATGVPLAAKAESSGGNYSVTHANFVIAYTKDNLAHLVYPGGIGKNDWAHDLPMLINENVGAPLGGKLGVVLFQPASAKSLL